MRKLFYFVLILPAAMLFFACGEGSKSSAELDSLRSEFITIHAILVSVAVDKIIVLIFR